MPGLTIDKLYEAYIDEDTSFAEDVFGFFGGTGSPVEWAGEYGMYLPSFDPTRQELSQRTRDIDLKNALDVLDLSGQIADRVYKTEADTLKTKLGAELEKGRAVAGGIGLRSGTLETATEGTIGSYANKVQNLGDRLQIQGEEGENKYTAAITDTTLDYEKDDRKLKSEFYNRTLAAIDKLNAVGEVEWEGAFQWQEGTDDWGEEIMMTCNDCDCSEWAGGGGPASCGTYCCAWAEDPEGDEYAVDSECPEGRDCAGVCGGTAVVDECGVCAGAGADPGTGCCGGQIDDGCGCGIPVFYCDDGTIYCDELAGPFVCPGG